jgi:hypothetical protein
LKKLFARQTGRRDESRRKIRLIQLSLKKNGFHPATINVRIADANTFTRAKRAVIGDMGLGVLHQLTLSHF